MAATGDEVLRLQRCHAARPGRSDGLPPLLVLHVAGSKHARNAGRGLAGRRLDVAVLVKRELRKWSQAKVVRKPMDQ